MKHRMKVKCRNTNWNENVTIYILICIPTVNINFKQCINSNKTDFVATVPCWIYPLKLNPVNLREGLSRILIKETISKANKKSLV